MPFVSEAQRKKLHALESDGKLPKGTCERWESHTPKGKLPERLHPPKARAAGSAAALKAYGLEKDAGFMGTLGRFGGKALQWGGKALGFAPTGIGNAAGAAIGGLGGAIEGFANGQGWRGALAHGVRGAASGAMPFGAGLATDAIATPMINRMLRPRAPTMPNSIGQV